MASRNNRSDLMDIVFYQLLMAVNEWFRSMNAVREWRWSQERCSPEFDFGSLVLYATPPTSGGTCKVKSEPRALCC